eukprot:c15075_g1_i1 orf=83-850(+)
MKKGGYGICIALNILSSSYIYIRCHPSMAFKWCLGVVSLGLGFCRVVGMALVSTAVSSKLPLCFSARPTPPEYSSSCRSYSPAGAAAADSIASVGPRLKLAHQNACTCCSLLAHLRAAPRCPGFNSSFFVDTRLQKLHGSILKFRRTKSQGGAISSSCLLVMSTESLQWIFSASAVLLMLLKNTAINRSLLVILLALEAPADAIGWLRGDYGMWTAFLALLVRLFYYIPGLQEMTTYIGSYQVDLSLWKLHIRGR